MTMRGRISAVHHQQNGGLWLRNVAASDFFHGFNTIGIQPVTQHEKTLESYVFEDNEGMIASVMNIQDMLEIFFFKECLRGWVKSCDKFGNMNDDYIDQQTFFVFKSSFYLCSFMVGPRTF